MADSNGTEVSTEQVNENEATKVEEPPMENESPEFTRDPILDTEEMKKMYVGGIPADSKDEDVKSYFEEFCGGKVTDHVIIRKDKDKKSHFGFLTFENSELLDEIILKKKELKFNGKPLDVKRAVPKSNTSPGAHEKTKKLFIANVPKTGCSEDDLKAYFEVRHLKKFGVVESVQLIKKKDEKGNKTEENKGFGFIMVSTEEMADKMAIQHATFDFGGRKIELKKSVPTAEGQGGMRGRSGGRGGMSRGGGMRGGRGGGGPYAGGAGYYGEGGGYGGYGGSWGYGGYDADYYGYGSYPPYGGGYAPPAPRGRGRGARYAPY